MRRIGIAIILTAAVSIALRGQTPRVHQFVPEKFYTTYSFAHPPALHINPGDRVVTKTIDAAGVDWTGKQVSSGGANPETGPFFIEGAEPDDMLIVTFQRMETNRTTGYSSSLLAPYTIDPQFIAARVDREPKRMTWTIDKAKGIAFVDSSDLKPSHLEVPLKTMLGCVGVAPARKEAITTTTPGAWGGNMDYVGVAAGAKVMLPVYEPGALLFIGLFPSVLSYLLWNRALAVIPPAVGGVFLNLITVYTATFTIITGKPLIAAQIIGGSIIIAGVVLASLANPTKRAKRPSTTG